MVWRSPPSPEHPWDPSSARWRLKGLSAAEMEGLFRAIDWARLGRIMVTSVSGAAFHDMLRESFGGILIEDLEIAYAAVCADLDTGEMVVLDTGDLAEAVCASSSIPGILPSRHLDGRRLVDGAVVEPVPVTAATAMGVGTVLAVNVVRLPTRRGVGRGHHDHDADSCGVAIGVSSRRGLAPSSTGRPGSTVKSARGCHAGSRSSVPSTSCSTASPPAVGSMCP